MRRVAYLGPENTFTHLAAQKRFGRSAQYIHVPTVEDVFRTVEREESDFGVVPIENSLEGAVTHTLDRFIDFKQSPARIFGEVELPIQHCLIIPRGALRQKIRIIYSHPQALAQCKRWLDKNYPQAVRREKSSTAEAVEELLRRGGVWGMKERGAIGRRELAYRRDLQAIPIPIDRENRTRFLVISLSDAAPARKNKTSLLFALKDKPGALHDALVPFKRGRINLTKIESRPSKRKAWEYLFFIDFEGHESEPRVRKVLSALRASTWDLRVLGSYPMERSS